MIRGLRLFQSGELEDWRYHVVVNVGLLSMSYLDIYRVGKRWYSTMRDTSTIQWALDLKTGAIREVHLDELPTASAASIIGLCSKHGIHMDEPKSKQRRS